MLEEFKKFIMRGNVLDLAVGVIVGGAFGKIVESLVKDVIMPPIGAVTAGVNVANLRYVVKQTDPPITPDMSYDDVAKLKGGIVIAYGNWINNIITFLIVAFCVFLVVKMVNKLYPPPKPADPEKPAQEKLLEEIRDLMKKQASLGRVRVRVRRSVFADDARKPKRRAPLGRTERGSRASGIGTIRSSCRRCRRWRARSPCPCRRRRS